MAAMMVAGLGTSGLTACSRLNQTERGAILGAAGGAAVGAVIGRQVGSTARGAILGAAVGGAAGAVIGRRMDRQAEELDAALPPGTTVQRVGEGIAVTFESGLLFPFNSTDLLPAGRNNLQGLAASLSRYPDTEVLIVGHTDDVGSDEYNQRLSIARAEAAASVLAAAGVPRNRIQTAGRGESEPIAGNVDDSSRQQNRRVEVAIFASEEYRNAVMRQSGGQ
ncbi:MAG: OmpA family protein [Gemmatimonadetes bacterium]|nr:OmpA family protein [Gemmatimonadota bacterium]